MNELCVAFSIRHSILIASNGDLDIDVARIAERMQYEPVKTDLAEYGFNTPDDLLAYLKLTPANMPAYIADMPVNTDDFSFLAFQQSSFKREPIGLKLQNIDKASMKQ